MHFIQMLIFCMIDFNVQIIVAFIFGLLGLSVFLFHLTKLFSKEKDKTELSVRIGLLLFFGSLALFCAYGVYQWSDFKNHRQKTTGTTIQVKTYPKRATQIEYEYKVNGKRYVG
jgi:hypothetical protein